MCRWKREDRPRTRLSPLFVGNAKVDASPFRSRVRRLARLRNAIDREHTFVPCSRLGPVRGSSLERNRMVTDAALPA